jgi:hypothetical protein
MRRPKKIAIRIVDEITADILERSGIGNEMEQVDDETRDEIRKTWIAIVVKALSAPGAEVGR